MFSGKVLNARALNSLVSSASKRDELWSQVSTIQKLAGSTSASSSPVNVISKRDLSCLTANSEHRDTRATNRQQQQYQQQLRFTSTTTPAAASGSIAVPVSATCNPKREASTQAQQQPNEAALHASSIDEPFRASDLVVIPCKPSERLPKPSVEKLSFGSNMTDHQFRVDHTPGEGWSTPTITKREKIEINVSAKALQYALVAFEGCKAYLCADGKIRFFRLEANIKRLLHSTRRLGLPEFDEQELVKCIHRLVQLEADWFPKPTPAHKMTSLYIRPTIMGTDPTLGVTPSAGATIVVQCSPASSYFSTGFKPVSLYANPNFVRAWPGGAGSAKLASNYAPTIRLQMDAQRRGHQQVLWLYDHDMKLTEVGTMNCWVSIRNENTGKIHLVTPPLVDGLILPGITRDSVIQLARQWDDVVVEERYPTIGEIRQLLKEGRLLEMFGTGTACVVCPISKIEMSSGEKLMIPSVDMTKEEQVGDDVMSMRILKTITDIQYGRTPHPWSRVLMQLD